MAILPRVNNGAEAYRGLPPGVLDCRVEDRGDVMGSVDVRVVGLASGIMVPYAVTGKVGPIRPVDSGRAFDTVGAIPAGGTLSIRLTPDVKAPTGELASLAPPLLEVVSTHRDRSQRSTRAESATRIDSIHNAATMREWAVV